MHPTAVTACYAGRPRQPRGGFARPDRALDRRGKPGLRPVAREEQVAPAGRGGRSQRVLFGGGGEGRALFLDDLPARHRGSQYRGPPRRPPRRPARASSRSRSTRSSAALTVTDSRSGKANTHSAVPPSSPIIGGVPAGGVKAKCPLTIARCSVGAVRPGTSDRRDPGGERQDHRLVRDRRVLDTVAPVEPRHPVALERQRAQAAARSPPSRRARRQPAERRIDERRGQAGVRDPRPHRPAALRHRFAQHVGGQPRRSGGGRSVEDGEQDRVEEPVP